MNIYYERQSGYILFITNSRRIMLFFPIIYRGQHKITASFPTEFTYFKSFNRIPASINIKIFGFGIEFTFKSLFR